MAASETQFRFEKLDNLCCAPEGKGSFIRGQPERAAGSSAVNDKAISAETLIQHIAENVHSNNVPEMSRVDFPFTFSKVASN